MAADYDGIGRTNVAVYRPSTGIWYVLHGDGTYIAVQQGGSGDIPAVGDYNGDGKADFGVFRSGSSFCVLYTGGAQGCTTWGTVGDIPTIVPYAVLNAYFPGLFGAATQGAGSPGSCSTPTLDNAPVPMTWVGSGIGYTRFNYVPQEGTTVPLRKNGPISQYFANATTLPLAQRHSQTFLSMPPTRAQSNNGPSVAPPQRSSGCA